MQYRANLAAYKFLLLTLVLLVATAPAFAVTVILEPSQDNSIYEDFPTNSNALGITLFTGNTASSTRRALLQFDVAGNIPVGATIASVQLDVTVDSAGPFAGVGDPYDLFRLDESWGEGTSSGSQTAGFGVAATPGDATWDARFYDAITPTLWTTPGGTLAAAGSATTGLPVGGSGSWLSTPSLVADVQDMLDNPGTDFGWAVLPVMTNPARSARRFSSREEPNAALRPLLTIEYASGPGRRGEVPDGDDVPAVPLTLSKTLTPAIKLDWSASCRASDTDYGVYEGTIGGLFDNHQQVVCSTAGALTHTLTPSSTRSYYLVVPNDGTDEGSYGDGSNDVERPQGTMFCFAQNIGSPVCP
ncbi:MAG: DNRLRE domain-containing protein [bacterium]|nr:DNRLRE domain-containing protein [bacterium]